MPAMPNTILNILQNCRTIAVVGLQAVIVEAKLGYSPRGYCASSYQKQCRQQAKKEAV